MMAHGVGFGGSVRLAYAEGSETVMEVHLTESLHARLANCASLQGRDMEELIQDVLARYVDDEARFLEAVGRGIAAADRGEFVEEAEMKARIEAMFPG